MKDSATLKNENSRLLREEIAQGACTLRGLPEIINVNHSNLCNLNCGICPRSQNEKGMRLSQESLMRITDALFPTARKAVLTMAGEPLLADFEFLLDEALRHDVKLDVMTNGVLLTPELYRSARRALDHLNVSLDSHLPELYERLRKGASFDHVDANLQALRKVRHDEPDEVLYSISAVVMNSTIDHLPGLIRHAATLGADAVILQRLRLEIMDLEDEAPASPDLEAACRAAQEAGINLVFTDLGFPDVRVKPLRPRVPEPMATPGICPFLVQNMDILFTGEVYACCIPTDHYMGNVVHHDPAWIWNSPSFVKLRRAHRSGRGTVFCSGCSQAPHLPARKPAWLNDGIKNARRIINHLSRKTSR